MRYANDIWRSFTTAPPRPPLVLPWVARVYGAEINRMLDEAWQACYLQGLLNGFLAGVLLATVVYVLFGRRR